MPTECGVVVAIPEAEPVVARFRDQFDPPAAWGVPAHVTVLYPFVSPADIDEPVRAELARAVASVRRFQVSFLETQWFDHGVLWLDPTPASSFRALTSAVWAAFPDYPPYGDEHTAAIPHLTVGRQAVGDLQGVEEEITRHLPVHADVHEVRLMCGNRAPGTWHTVETFALQA